MFPFQQVWKKPNVHRGSLKGVDAVLLRDRLRALSFGMRARYMPYPTEQETGRGGRNVYTIPGKLRDRASYEAEYVSMDGIYSTGNVGTLALKMRETSHFECSVKYPCPAEKSP